MVPRRPIASEPTDVSAVLAEIRAALRSLRRRPATTVAAAVTLGLGITAVGLGAATLEQMLMRRLPFENPASLFTLYETQSERNAFRELSYQEVLWLQHELINRAQLAAFSRIWAPLGEADHPSQTVGELVTRNYFSVLGVEPAVGRFFDPAEGASDLVVLSHRLWRQQFEGRPDVIGRTVRLNRNSFTVIGVAPAGFRGPAWDPDFWAPIEAEAAIWGSDEELLQDASLHWLQTIGRLRQGVVPETGAGPVFDRMDHPDTDDAANTWALEMLPARQLRIWPAYRGTVARVLGGFGILALLVLATAAANLSTMMIAQGQVRAEEMAIRRALGAGRAQLSRRLAAEVGILGAAGTFLGLVFMRIVAPLVVGLPLPVPAHVDLSFDGGAAALGAFAGVCGCLLLGLLVGLVELRDVDATQASMGGLRQSRVAATLVTAQVAGSTILLVAMSLLLRSAWNAAAIDPGFRTSGITTASITLDRNTYDDSNGGALYAQLLSALARHPGVEAVALSSSLLLQPVRTNVEITSPADAFDVIDARLASVSSGYLELLEVPLLAGRAITDSDRRDGEQVAVIGETLARLLGGTPVGSQIRLSWDAGSRTIIGVVADYRYNSLTGAGVPFVHVPLDQLYWPQLSVLLRAREPGLNPAMAALRDALSRLDRLIPIDDPKPLVALVDRALAESRTNAAIASAFGSLGLILAVTGLYGTVAHSLAARRREIAIRSAVGATPGKLRREALTKPLRGVLVGVAAGLVGAYLAAGALVASLVDVPARDVGSFAAAAMAVMAVSVGVGWLPATRAALQEPAGVLRAE